MAMTVLNMPALFCHLNPVNYINDLSCDSMGPFINKWSQPRGRWSLSKVDGNLHEKGGLELLVSWLLCDKIHDFLKIYVSL